LVKTILDNFCVRSGVLCGRCEEKVREGLINQLDLKVITWFIELEENFPSLKEIRFHKAVETDRILVILVDRKDMAKVLSHGGKIIRTLAERIGKRVKLLSYGSDIRDFLEELLSPFSILTINTVWLPDGTTETKVILPGKKPRRMPIDLDVVKKIAQTLMNLSLRIEFERG
jgi:transcription antitermination factor NusA-like protein